MDKKIFVVAKREYLERVRSRWFIVITLLVPAVMAGAILFPVYMAAHGGASSSIRHVEIIDVTGSGLGDQVAKSLMSDKSLSAAPDSVQPRVVNITAAELPAKEAAAAAEVEQPNHITGYIVLDDSTLAGASARYAGRDASSLSDMDKLTSVIRDEVMIVRLQHEGVRADIVGDLARNRLKLNSERLTDRGRSGSGTAGIFAGLGVGIMLMMLILIHGQNILRGVLEEKSTRVAEVVISSVKPETLLAGKVLGVGAVGLTQQAAWLAIGGYLTNFLLPIVLKGAAAGAAAGATASAAAPTNPLSNIFSGGSIEVIGVAVVYFIVGFVFYATLYAAAGSMVNSEQEAQQASVPVMILIMSTWLLVNPVLLAPNGKLATVLSWLPWASPIIMPMRMGLTSVSPASIAGSIVVAIIGSIGAMWLSARIYRVGMLMYGKKPSFAEMMKWIRYA
ncbi:MAG TPA: ABC transporter permease [Gemmatimonadaceae bacterium]|nr:ABC transporter permease [Gemmatimonadaceae bacterium]